MSTISTVSQASAGHLTSQTTDAPATSASLFSQAFAHQRDSFFQNSASPGLTPDTAMRLMYRSMTTGVPTAELEQYGGYAAVKSMFEAHGGQYDLSTIPSSLRRELAQQVAATGVGNALVVRQENLAFSPSAFEAMANAGISKTVIEQLRKPQEEDKTAAQQPTSETPTSSLMQMNSAPVQTLTAVSGPIVSAEQPAQVSDVTSTALREAIEEAAANLPPFLDSTTYLSSLFKA